MPRLKVVTLLSLATLFAPAFGQGANPAGPGTVNYIEGHASIDGREVSAKSVGGTVLDKGQTLATADGKVEVLLTPGVFLRLGENSTVRMISPDLTKTEVALDRGTAEVEVDQLHRQNDLLIDQAGAQTHVLKDGLYGFDASAVRVFDGKAEVFPTAGSEKGIDVKGGHELALNGESTKPHDFSKKQAETDALYKWGSLRSEYLGEANARLASEYAGSAGFNPGWNWDQGLYAYTWMPGDGLFWNPYGFGFYSPAYFYGGGYYYGRPFYGGFRGGYRGGYGYRSGGYHTGGVVGRSSVGTAGGFHGGGGGGFHGAGGGMHGGRR